MTLEKILENICVYDDRSPYYDAETAAYRFKSSPCYCDNCYNGCHALAVEVLRLQGIIDGDKI